MKAHLDNNWAARRAEAGAYPIDWHAPNKRADALANQAMDANVEDAMLQALRNWGLHKVRQDWLYLMPIYRIMRRHRASRGAHRPPPNKVGSLDRLAHLQPHSTRALDARPDGLGRRLPTVLCRAALQRCADDVLRFSDNPQAHGDAFRQLEVGRLLACATLIRN